jgi:Mn2+/Fe2+ NRAMP family transporter
MENLETSIQAVDIDTTATTITPQKVTKVRSRWMRNLVWFLMVLGPGLIVMEADNDAGAVSTYTQAGAQYGTHLLWVLFLLLPITYFVQEMVARLGIATGQGHAALIFQRFGKKWGIFSVIDLLLVNFLTLVTEFAAVALSLSQLGISPYISVPVAAVGLTLLVSTGKYLRWERITLFLCLLDISWLALALLTHPNGAQVLHDSLVPQLPAGGLSTNLVFLVTGIVGTTIAPWQLFFQQSCVADKKLRFADLKWERLDTFIGACFTIIIAAFMMLVGAAAFHYHIPFSDPAQMATALGPILGPVVRIGVPIMMVNAAILGATAISLSSSWAISEVRGWDHSLNRSIKDAPKFYIIYSLCVVAAAIIVLLPGAPLQLIIIGVQVLAGVILPPMLIFLQLLLNDHELLGPEFVNKPWNNIVNWTIVVVLFLLSLVLAAQVIAPTLFPA